MRSPGPLLLVLAAALGGCGLFQSIGLAPATPDETAVARVPIVPAAVIFDLAVGSGRVRPNSEMGYRACMHASSGIVEEGRVGAGAGATVGKMLGQARAAVGGIASTSRRLASGATVGVLVVVNAFGDVVDSDTGRVLAGAGLPDARTPSASPRKRSASLDTLLGYRGTRSGAQEGLPSAVENTTLAVVATDAALLKAQARRVAMMAHDGMARAIRPAHTMYDGDTIFALSTGNLSCDVNTIGVVAAELLARAIARVGLWSSTLSRKRSHG